MAPPRAPASTLLAAVGHGVALAALLFPPLFAVREARTLGDALAALAAALLGVTEVSGLKLVDLARQLDGGTRDPVFVGWAVAAGAAVMGLVACGWPRVSRLLAVVGLGGVAATAILPRVVADDRVTALGELVRRADPAAGFYVTLAAFALVVVAGVAGRGG